MSVSSQSILQEFVKSRSESAFRELVTDHMPLVYSTALRRTNYASGIAQDVAQDVFTRLARKADSLPKDVCLPAWLYRQTCRIAANSMRGEDRRLKRESLASDLMNNPESAPEHELVGELDEAMMKLPKTAREVLILRFFGNQDHRTVGKILGVSEEAARKRTDRALDALRRLFEKRGLRVSTPAVVAALTGLNSKNLSAATSAQISSQALKSPALKASLATTLTGVLAGILGVSTIAGGILTTRKTSAQTETPFPRLSERTHSPSPTSETANLITRIKQTCQGPENILGQIKLFALLEELTDQEIPAFVASSSDQLTRLERELCYNHLLKRWMKSDPVSAMNFALTSQVSLLIKYENLDQHDSGPDERFLYNLASGWSPEKPSKAFHWSVEHHEEIENLHGRSALEILTTYLMLQIGDNEGVQAQLHALTQVPTQLQVDALKQIYCVEGGGAFLQLKNIPGLLDHLPKVTDPTLQEELRQSLWTAWASKQPDEMLVHLATLEGKEALKARLALLGPIHPLGEIQTFAGGNTVNQMNGEPYATLQEREQDALETGLATGLTKTEAQREIVRWLALHGASQQVTALIARIEGSHGSDGALEDAIRAKLRDEELKSSDRYLEWHTETLNLALLIENQERRREITRAIFRDSLQYPSLARFLLDQTDPAESLRPELEAMMNQKK
ncbi:sigma-70 family RNA polymerase sigma factor [Verrucomicrobiaceae bacterium 227]